MVCMWYQKHVVRASEPFHATLERPASLDGLEAVSLAVTVGNGGARKLSLLAGFVPFGVEPRYIKVGARYFDIERMIVQVQDIRR